MRPYMVGNYKLYYPPAGIESYHNDLASDLYCTWGGGGGRGNDFLPLWDRTVCSKYNVM